MRRLLMRVFSAGLRSSFHPWAKAGLLKRPRSRWTGIPPVSRTLTPVHLDPADLATRLASSIYISWYGCLIQFLSIRDGFIRALEFTTTALSSNRASSPLQEELEISDHTVTFTCSS
jgi:hypothetical protein